MSEASLIAAALDDGYIIERELASGGMAVVRPINSTVFNGQHMVADQ